MFKSLAIFLRKKNKIKYIVHHDLRLIFDYLYHIMNIEVFPSFKLFLYDDNKIPHLNI